MGKVKSDFAKSVDLYSDSLVRLRRWQYDIFRMSEAVRTLSNLNIPIPKKLSQALAQARLDEKTLRRLADCATLKAEGRSRGPTS